MRGISPLYRSYSYTKGSTDISVTQEDVEKVFPRDMIEGFSKLVEKTKVWNGGLE